MYTHNPCVIITRLNSIALFVQVKKGNKKNIKTDMQTDNPTSATY